MKTCPECGSTELFERNDLLSTGHYPILRGLGGFLQFATIRVVLCADCGLIRQYASEEARAKAKTKWARTGIGPSPTPVRSESDPSREWDP